MALGSRHPHISHLYQKGHLIPNDLVKCLLMALFDQTRIPCSLLELPATLGGGAPQRNTEVLLPQPGVWMLSRENRGCLLRCPVLGNGAAQGQHPTYKPPGAPCFPLPRLSFWTFRKCFLDILFP